MQYEHWQSLTQMFFEQAEALGDKPFLWAKHEGVYTPQTWREVKQQVCALSHGLTALGIKPGDRVALVSENRPKWLIADIAIMAAGAITVPAYTTNTPDDHLHILSDSGAKAAIVSTGTLAERVLAAAMRASSMQAVIVMEPLQLTQHPGVRTVVWDDVSAEGAARAAVVPEPVATAKRGDTACLIYTSGTGGAPKGVMLSHGAILCNCMGAHGVLQRFGLVDEVFLSFLPLSHSYEHTAGQFFPISLGAQIYYAEGIDALGRNMVEARPTIMTAVPRLYETMHSRIALGVSRQGGLKEKLFNAAVALGRQEYERPGSLSFIQRIENAILDVLVRRKVKARFGGRLKALVSGGAPLNPEIGIFFTALGLKLLQGYGQTEAAPVVSCNPPNKVKLHTVGPPMDGVEVKIAEDGEILIRGELVMNGYWNNADATAEVLHDGWLHTGDVGLLDEDGYIQITDRKKDIIVNSGGDNIAPQRIEGILALEHEIAQVMVNGDRRPYLVALIVPDAETARAWAREQDKPEDLRSLAEDAEFRKMFSETVERVNKELSVIERVRRFKIVSEPFSVENGQLTPTLKIRRHKIREIYGAAIEAMYNNSS